MMSIEQRTTLNGMGIEQSCFLCGGTGKLFVYRSDLEEYDEIECEMCKKI